MLKEIFVQYKVFQGAIILCIEWLSAGLFLLGSPEHVVHLMFDSMGDNRTTHTLLNKVLK